MSKTIFRVMNGEVFKYKKSALGLIVIALGIEDALKIEWRHKEGKALRTKNLFVAGEWVTAYSL